MRIAECGSRNRNVEDSYETEEESLVRSNERIQFRCSRSTFRNPQSAIRISHLLGCTFAATFSRSPFKEMNPVASDWL